MLDMTALNGFMYCKLIFTIKARGIPAWQRSPYIGSDPLQLHQKHFEVS